MNLPFSLPRPGVTAPRFSPRLTGAIAVGTLLFSLASCTPSPSPTPPSSPPAIPSANPAASSPPSPAPSAHGGQGGQVIESGPYHLELVTLKESGGVHLDFYLQTGDDHTPIANATVVAQIQGPSGAPTQLPLRYDASGKHYAALLAPAPAGNYRLVILSDIKGEKVNARFNLKL